MICEFKILWQVKYWQELISDWSGLYHWATVHSGKSTKADPLFSRSGENTIVLMDVSTTQSSSLTWYSEVQVRY